MPERCAAKRLSRSDAEASLLMALWLYRLEFRLRIYKEQALTNPTTAQPDTPANELTPIGKGFVNRMFGMILEIQDMIWHWGKNSGKMRRMAAQH